METINKKVCPGIYLLLAVPCEVVEMIIMFGINITN